MSEPESPASDGEVGVVAVVGLGLIGGSVGAAARHAGFRVRGIDASASRTRQARRLGLIDEEAATSAAAVAAADMVVVATPPAVLRDVLPAIDAAAPAGATIMDVASVKRPVVAVMALLPGARRCIGGHPLAGKESSWPEAAEAHLFAERPWILSPSAATADETVASSSSFVTALGARPVVLDAGAHDAALARTSHLPQIVSTALALCTAPGDGAVTGPAFWGMTRLAASDPDLWTDILLANRRPVVTALRAMQGELEAFGEVLDIGDARAVREILARGGAALRDRREETE